VSRHVNRFSEHEVFEFIHNALRRFLAFSRFAVFGCATEHLINVLTFSLNR